MKNVMSNKSNRNLSSRINAIWLSLLVFAGVASFTACNPTDDPTPIPTQPTITTHRVNVVDLADLSAKLAGGDLQKLLSGNNAKDSVLIVMPRIGVGSAADIGIMKQFNTFLADNKNARADWLNGGGGVYPSVAGFVMSLADWDAIGRPPLMLSDNCHQFYPAAGDDVAKFCIYALAFKKWDNGDYNFEKLSDFDKCVEIENRAKAGDKMTLSFHWVLIDAAAYAKLQKLAAYRANLTLVGAAYPIGKVSADKEAALMLAPVAKTTPNGGLYVKGADGALDLGKQLTAGGFEDIYFITDTATVGADKHRIPDNAFIRGAVWARDMLGYINGMGTDVEYKNCEPSAVNTILGPNDAFFANASTPAATLSGAKMRFKQDPIVGSQILNRDQTPVGGIYGPINITRMDPHAYAVLERSGQVANQGSPFRINEFDYRPWSDSEYNICIPQSVGNVKVNLSDFGQGIWDLESLSRFAFVLGKYSYAYPKETSQTDITVDRNGYKIAISAPRYFLEVVRTLSGEPVDIEGSINNLGTSKLGLMLEGFEKIASDRDFFENHTSRIFSVYPFQGLTSSNSALKILTHEEISKIKVPGDGPMQILQEYPGFSIGR